MWNAGARTSLAPYEERHNLANLLIFEHTDCTDLGAGSDCDSV
jgi:hypothetical protein